MPARSSRFTIGKAAVSALCLAISACSTCSLQAAPGDAASGWSALSDPPAAALTWPSKLSISIELPSSSDKILFPRTPSEYCLSGIVGYESDRAELWNLASGKRVARLGGSPAWAKLRALSPDGKYLAVAALDPEKANDIEVWSLGTGKQLTTFQADERDMHMTILDFAGDGEVLSYTFGEKNGQFLFHLSVWDVQTGKPLRHLQVNQNISGNERYDISPGRKWLATILTFDVGLYDLQTGESRGTISPSRTMEDGQTVSLDSVRFSPDGAEIACLSGGSRGSVISVYDMATGDLKLRHELSASLKSALQNPSSYEGPAIEFVQEPAGFLWHGQGFIERESGLLVWTYRQGLLESNHGQRILTPAGLIASTGGSNARKLEVVPFPAQKLKKSLAAFHKDSPALVKPGAKVKLIVKVNEVRFGTPAEAQQSIENALAERLAEDGLEVDEGGATILAVQYKEGVGSTLQEFTGGNRFGVGGTATGRSVQSTAAELKLKWTSKDRKTKIYEHVENLDPGFLSVRDELTEEKVREQVFNILKLRLAQLPMPYFVPNDKDLAVLPMTTASKAGAAEPSSANAALKKKIEAAKRRRRGQ